ncbi:UDP-N-acetylmuramoyl-L-alanyl-D-glutamate--2,6-diaminopimelate ligase [Mollicutes bacterium LVI A0039]|nr:UDP-N-acetylmuramoyl-L-alanyl-D-glutamate--2,6-diaminopimelate ligase [Mollicutes bacterium LVI A0039]
MKANQLLDVTSTVEITNITNDSRAIKPGGLYFAIKGLTVDGHDYISSAITNGAVAIIHTSDVEQQAGILYVKVPDIYVAYNKIASDFWGNPATKLKVIGTTGTNGKSTTSWIIDDILNRKYSCGYIGTIGIKAGEELLPSTFTTLLPHQYNQIFSDMVASNKEYAAIEVSSQGLDQHRTDFLEFDYAIMTNLTHEHLDYHITMENYLQAKALLFTQVKPQGLAIINNDDLASASYLIEHTKGKVVTYGIDHESDIMAKDVKLLPSSTEFTLVYFGAEYPLKTNLVGRFNVYNLLAAIAVVLDAGITIEELQEMASNLTQVEGRMVMIENDKDLNVIVDYAHTPDGFTQVYKHIQTISTGKIISVFGSAGLRDVLKRPILGEISDQYSDLIILTADDPKKEDPKVIADEIAAGIKTTPIEYIEDREAAIYHAFAIAKPGDTIAILSKGHDAYQKGADGLIPYDGDVVIAKRASLQ